MVICGDFDWHCEARASFKVVESLVVGKKKVFRTSYLKLYLFYCKLFAFVEMCFFIDFFLIEMQLFSNIFLFSFEIHFFFQFNIY